MRTPGFRSSILDCRFTLLLLMITFANSLNLDQARQNVGPDLDPNCLSLLLCPETVNVDK